MTAADEPAAFAASGGSRKTSNGLPCCVLRRRTADLGLGLLIGERCSRSDDQRGECQPDEPAHLQLIPQHGLQYPFLPERPPTPEISPAAAGSSRSRVTSWTVAASRGSGTLTGDRLREAGSRRQRCSPEPDPRRIQSGA